MDYDALNGFPDTPNHLVLPWETFNANINSTEADPEVALDIIEENYEEWVDLRPYMIESPMTVMLQDRFYKVLEQFRLNHLRHMCVIDPSNGALRGIITRKDIFAYNGL